MKRIAARIGDSIRFVFAGVGTGTYRAVTVIVGFFASISPFEWLPYLREDRRRRGADPRDDHPE
jgi:hypothetical protein